MWQPFDQRLDANAHVQELEKAADQLLEALQNWNRCVEKISSMQLHSWMQERRSQCSSRTVMPKELDVLVNVTHHLKVAWGQNHSFVGAVQKCQQKDDAAASTDTSLCAVVSTHSSGESVAMPAHPPAEVQGSCASRRLPLDKTRHFHSDLEWVNPSEPLCSEYPCTLAIPACNFWEPFQNGNDDNDHVEMGPQTGGKFRTASLATDVGSLMCDMHLEDTSKSDMDGEFLTAMIRNIPAHCTRQQILDVIHLLGFQGKYNFFHMALFYNGKNNARTKNKGWAFINFPDSNLRKQFQEAITGCSFASLNSTKVVAIERSHVQGLAALQKLFKNLCPLGASIS